ncbi:MAG: hypothetical protein QXX17_07310 [Conexivisphaerales archaeon]
MAEKALQLDPECLPTHSILGFLLLNYDFNFSQARKEFEKVLLLNPGDSTARIFLARTYALYGDLARAKEEGKIATEYDPLSRLAATWKAVIHWLSGQEKEAFIAIDEAIRLNPSPLGPFFKIVFLINAQRFDDAEKELIAIGQAMLKEPLLKAQWAYIQAKRGQQGGCEQNFS